MADKKISELTAADTLTGAELVEIVQGGVNKQSTTQDIADLGGGGGTWGSITGTLSAQTDLQSALDAKATTGSVSTVANDLSNHISDATDAHDASAISFSATGNIAATDVQAAIQELDSEKIGSAAVVGVQDLFIPAAAMWPRVTGGCAPLNQFEMATSLFNVQALAFDQTTQEFAQCQVVLPRKWNGGTVTVVPYWTAQSGTGTVQWGISGGAYSNDDALTVALGTAQTSDDTLIATNDLHIGPATSAITLAGTPADADFLAIQISRNPASDTLTGDALLLGISIRITTDSAIDS